MAIVDTHSTVLVHTLQYTLYLKSKILQPIQICPFLKIFFWKELIIIEQLSGDGGSN